MDAPREIELKLECTGPDLAVLAAHPLLQGEGASTELLTSTYFDTQAGDLRAAGLTLRVRRQGETFTQTVKSGEIGAGLFDRAEWESAISGEMPEAAAYADTPVARTLGKAKAPALRPLFASVVQRSTRLVTHGQSRISATLDEGRVESEAGDAVLCELELELISGETGDLLTFAQALAESVPLRLGVLSKSARGFAIRDGQTRRPRKAEPLALPEDATTAEALRRIALACLRHLRINEDVFLASRDPEALHQIRVSLRRLRSAFSLFKPVLEHDPRAQAFSDEIKRVTEPFGKARNLDVFLETTLPAEMERRPDEPGLTDLRVRLEIAQGRAHDAVHAILESREWRGLILDLLAWIETGSWTQAPAVRDVPARDFAVDVLDRYRTRVRKRGRRLDRLDPEARHRVRIAAKKLRYGAEFFAGLFPKKKARRRHKSFGTALSDLQDHLGALNDLATAHAVMAELAQEGAASGDEAASGPALFAAGLTAGDNEAQTATLLKAAAEAHDALIDVKPFWH